jgi:aminopeptidase N
MKSGLQDMKVNPKKHLLFIFIILVLFSKCFIYSQQIENIDFKECNLNLYINPHKALVEGEIRYDLSARKNTDSLYLDARSLKFKEVKLNGKIPKTVYDDNRLVIYKKLKKGKKYSLVVKYQAKPKQAMYFIGWENPKAQKQVWTQGQGKNNSHWVPCIEDVREKAVYNITVTFHKDFEVIANGELRRTKLHSDSLKTWKFTMQKPMSSYLLAIAAGNYYKKITYSKSKIPIELYYYPLDSGKVEPTYRFTKEMFDFLEEKIGFSYPWKVYKQVPVKDFLYAGMENTTATFFSDSYVVDSTAFTDKNYLSVNAHEMAHQWFGDLVTACTGQHHWLQEGFATYYALQAQREILGEDFYFQKLYESAKQLIALSKVGKGESLLDPKASSLTFYEKGAWILHMLANQVGEEVFDEAVKRYVSKFKFGCATTEDFIETIEKTSGIDLSEFNKIWFQSKNIPVVKAHLNRKTLEILENDANILLPSRIQYVKSDTVIDFTVQGKGFSYPVNRYKEQIRSLQLNDAYKMLIDLEFKRPEYLMLDQLRNGSNLAVKLDAIEGMLLDSEVLSEILEGSYAQTLKEVAIYQMVQNMDSIGILQLKIVLKGHEIKLRQAVASSLKKIPLELKPLFESLLEDKSYMTIENALLNLWINFPDDRKRYLEITKNIQGFNDKNIRILWLALAMATADYNAQLTPEYYNELSGYTDRYYHFEIRKNAFTYLYQLQILSNKNLEDLIHAGNHPVWRFASFARKLLENLLKDKDYYTRLEAVAQKLTDKDTDWILKKLKKAK